ncbi:MAG: TlpA disulfide reductase family protein [Arachidicoccus sp.]|nr:TlpA disulfide reductase family protein [Arachidicoccus sp.]
MKLSITIIVTILAVSIFAQEPLLKQGNLFPDMIIKNITNASVKSIDLNATKDGKFYILNFWGTWCSPCIPEMDSLAKLQKIYKDKIQVIGISDDNEVRKQNYLKKKPSTLWLATDTSWFLSSLFRFSSVGQSFCSPEELLLGWQIHNKI